MHGAIRGGILKAHAGWGITEDPACAGAPSAFNGK